MTKRDAQLKRLTNRKKQKRHAERLLTSLTWTDNHFDCFHLRNYQGFLAEYRLTRYVLPPGDGMWKCILDSVNITVSVMSPLSFLNKDIVITSWRV